MATAAADLKFVRWSSLTTSFTTLTNGSRSRPGCKDQRAETHTVFGIPEVSPAIFIAIDDGKSLQGGAGDAPRAQRQCQVPDEKGVGALVRVILFIRLRVLLEVRPW